MNEQDEKLPHETDNMTEEQIKDWYKKEAGKLSLAVREASNDCLEAIKKRADEAGIKPGKPLWLFCGRVVNSLFAQVYEPSIKIMFKGVSDQLKEEAYSGQDKKVPDSGRDSETGDAPGS